MASDVDWKSLGGKDGQKGGGGGGKRSNFLRFESGKKYKIRLVGSPVEHKKFWVQTPKGRRPVTVELEDSVKAATVLSEHCGREIKPSHKYAINCIDRADGDIKICEAGKQVFKAFATWARETDQHPGGMGGVDWLIEVDGDGLDREYTVMPLQQTPYSKEEIAMIKEEGKVFNLKQIFKGVAPEEIIEKAFGEGTAGPDNETPQENSPPPQAAETTEPALAGSLSDDPVNW